MRSPSVENMLTKELDIVVLRHVAAPRSDEPRRRVDRRGFLILVVGCVMCVDAWYENKKEKKESSVLIIFQLQRKGRRAREN